MFKSFQTQRKRDFIWWKPDETLRLKHDAKSSDHNHCRCGDDGRAGFYIEERNGEIFALGGNQNDAVCIAGHDPARLLGLRGQA
jgi:hypothetical protein